MAKKLAEKIRKTKPTIDPDKAEKEFREFVAYCGWSMRYLEHILAVGHGSFQGIMARGFNELEADVIEQHFKEIGLKLLQFKMPDGMKYWAKKKNSSLERYGERLEQYKERLEQYKDRAK